MSLEQALADLGKKLDETIALQKREIELREQGLEAVGKAGEKAGVTKKETKAAETKSEVKEEKKPASSSGDSSSDEIMETAKTKIAEYVGGTDRDDERTARKAKIKKLLNHKDVKKADAPETTTNLADVKPEMLAAVVKNVEKYIAAGDITTPPASDDLDID